MLIPFKDADSGNTFWVNPEYVNVVFEGKNPQGDDVTVIGLGHGNLATDEDLLSVVGKIQGDLSGK